MLDGPALIKEDSKWLIIFVVGLRGIRRAERRGIQRAVGRMDVGGVAMVVVNSVLLFRSSVVPAEWQLHRR